jgi:hypothetical protein
MKGLHTVGVLQLKSKYHFQARLHVVYIFMGFVCDYYMYDFTILFALCCVIEKRKSFVKYWCVLLLLPQEYVNVHNVYVWLKLHYMCVCVCILDHIIFLR